jgi:excisionase family DNA binding protein
MAAARTGTDRPSFYSVSEVADLFGMSGMTLYRAIREGQFPAIRVRGRVIIPARVIDALVDAAATSGELVDAADWVSIDPSPEESPSRLRPQMMDRPRPGANQTGAGSPVTQQGARGEVSSMTDPRSVGTRRSVGRRTSAAGGVR